MRTRDAFTKYLARPGTRVSWDYVDVRGARRSSSRGRISNYIPNPTFDVVARPGSMEEYFRHGNPEGKDRRTLFGQPMRSIPAFPRAPVPRLELMNEQGHRSHAHVSRRSPVCSRSAFVMTPEATHAGDPTRSTSGCTRTWETSTTRVGIFATPVITLPIVRPARSRSSIGSSLVAARVVLIRPRLPWPGFRGPRSFALPEFDPFWERGRRAWHPRRPALVPIAATIATPNEWVGSDSEMLPFQPQAFRMMAGVAAGRGPRVGVPDLPTERSPASPELKVAVIENGSSWVEPLLQNLADAYKKMPQDFLEEARLGLHSDRSTSARFLGEDDPWRGSAELVWRRPRAVRVGLPPMPRVSPVPPTYVEELEGLPRRGGPQDHGRKPRSLDERRTCRSAAQA